MRRPQSNTNSKSQAKSGGRHQSKQPPKQHFKLSDHFSKRDFVCRCGKCDSSLKISLGLLGGLEFLRSKSRSRIEILKGYECPESAENHGKVKRNFHTMGVAADITLERQSIEDAFLIAETIPEFLGIGLNLKHGHLHVDTRKDKVRHLWVVTVSGEHIELTDDNRRNYLPSITPEMAPETEQDAV